MYAGLDRAGYRLAGWSFGDVGLELVAAVTSRRNSRRRLAGRASDGDIVVMHDGHHDNPRADRRRTVQATAELIPLLKARDSGLEISAKPSAVTCGERRRTT